MALVHPDGSTRLCRRLRGVLPADQGHRPGSVGAASQTPRDLPDLRPERPRAYPNDEGFVATTVVTERLSAAALDAIAPEVFRYFGFGRLYSLPDLLEVAGDGHVIHEALDAPEYLERGRRRFRQYFGSNPQFTKLVSSYFHDLTPSRARELQEIVAEELREALTDRS